MKTTGVPKPLIRSNGLTDLGAGLVAQIDWNMHDRQLLAGCRHPLAFLLTAHLRACHLPFDHTENRELLSKRMPMGDDLLHHGVRP